MSFSSVLKGANLGVVYSLGQKCAHFQFLLLRYTSVTDHKTSTQKLGIRAL